jgi:hypothetical protein
MKTILSLFTVFIAAVTWQGCGSEEAPEPIDCTKDPVQLSLVSVQNTNCDQSDGSIEVKATGGAGSYEYSLKGGAGQTSAIFNNIAAGVYEITAKDANECSATMAVTVANQDGLNISFETSVAGCKQSDGSITVTATDGTEPYQFKLGSGSFTTNNTFSSLSSGEHDLVVTDASGCTINQSVKVGSGVSFSASVSPIISSKCATSSCHGGTQGPDLRVFKNIQDNAAQIKTVTANGSMPKNGSLTQAEKDLIACWVDDGALNN